MQVAAAETAPQKQEHIGGDRHLFVQAMVPREAVSVLDIGCGYGWNLGYLHESGRDLCGVDMDEAALAQAQRTYPDVRFVHQTGAELPFEDESFDAVILSEVIEHVGDENKPLVVSEAHRVLRPGGTFIFTAPYDGLFAPLDPMDFKRRNKGLYAFYMRRSGYVPSTTPEVGHKHVTLKEIEKLFSGKFAIEYIQYSGGMAEPLLTWCLAFISRLRLVPPETEHKIGMLRAHAGGKKMPPKLAFSVRLTAKRLP